MGLPSHPLGNRHPDSCNFDCSVWTFSFFLQSILDPIVLLLQFLFNLCLFQGRFTQMVYLPCHCWIRFCGLILLHVIVKTSQTLICIDTIIIKTRIRTAQNARFWDNLKNPLVFSSPSSFDFEALLTTDIFFES